MIVAVEVTVAGVDKLVELVGVLVGEFGSMVELDS